MDNLDLSFLGGDVSIYLFIQPNEVVRFFARAALSLAVCCDNITRLFLFTMFVSIVLSALGFDLQRGNTNVVLLKFFLCHAFF